MRKVYSAENLFWLQLAKNALDYGGVPSEIRNEFAGGAMGDLSFIDCWPELWVEEQHLEKANGIIEELLAVAPEEHPDRPCPICQQPCPAHFERCWHCQSPLDVLPAS